MADRLTGIISSDVQDEYDDDEKYWYQTRIPSSDVFDDTSGFADLLSATKTELASLNKTRLDLVEGNTGLLEVQASNPSVDHSIPESGSLVDPHEFQRANIVGRAKEAPSTPLVQSARYGLSRTNNVSSDSSNVLSASYDERRYGKSAMVQTKQGVPQYRQPQQDYSTGRFNYSTCLPSSFYNSQEFDSDHHDYKRLVLDLMFNRSVDLMQIRSKTQKEKLLKTAIQMGDANALTPILLHLKNTMSPAQFYTLLKGKSWIRGKDAELASSHYVAYLKLFEHPDVVTRELQQIGLVEDAIKYNMYLFNRTFDAEFKALVEQGNTTNSDDVVAFIGQQYKQLLTMLGALQDVQYGKFISQQMFYLDIKKRLFHDLAKATPTNAIFKELAEVDCPRSVVKFAVLHPKLSSGMELIGQRFEMFDQQVAFVELECLAEECRWDELRQAVLGSHFGKRLMFGKAVPYEVIVDVASDAPKDFLVDIIKRISNARTRYEMAEHHECFDLAVDILAFDLRDRAKLDLYRRTIPRDHPAYMKAVQALSSMPAPSERKTDMSNLLASSGAINSALASGAEMASGIWKKERSRLKELFHRKS